MLLQECEMWDIVNNTQAKLVTVPIDATTKEEYKKKNIKSKRIILDAIKDHVIPHIIDKGKCL